MKKLLIIPLLFGTLVYGQEINFSNGAKIDNTETDTITISEVVTKVDGTLYVTGSLIHSHSGGLAYVSTPGTMTINTGGTFEKLDEGAIAYTAGHIYNFTHDDGRLTYTGTPTIHVTIRATVTVESGETSQVVQLRLAKNGATIAGSNMSRTFRATSTDSAIPLGWLAEMATGNYFEVFGTSTTNDDKFDIINLTLTVTKH